MMHPDRRRLAWLCVVASALLTGCAKPHLNPLPSARSDAVLLSRATSTGVRCLYVPTATGDGAEVYCGLGTRPVGTFTKTGQARRTAATEESCVISMSLNDFDGGALKIGTANFAGVIAGDKYDVRYDVALLPVMSNVMSEALCRYTTGINKPVPSDSQVTIPREWRMLGHAAAARDDYFQAALSYQKAFDDLIITEEKKTDDDLVNAKGKKTDRPNTFDCELISTKTTPSTANREKAELMAAMALVRSNMGLDGAITQHRGDLPKEAGKEMSDEIGNKRTDAKDLNACHWRLLDCDNAIPGTVQGYGAMLWANLRRPDMARHCANLALKALRQTEQDLRLEPNNPTIALTRFGRARDTLTIDLVPGDAKETGNDEGLSPRLRLQAVQSQIMQLQGLLLDAGAACDDIADSSDGLSIISQGRANRMRAMGNCQAAGEGPAADPHQAQDTLRFAADMMDWVQMDGRPTATARTQAAMLSPDLNSTLGDVARQILRELPTVESTIADNVRLEMLKKLVSHCEDNDCSSQPEKRHFDNLVYALMGAGPTPLLAQSALQGEALLTQASAQMAGNCALQWVVYRQLTQMEHADLIDKEALKPQGDVPSLCPKTKASDASTLQDLRNRLNAKERVIAFALGEEYGFGMSVTAEKGLEIWRINEGKDKIRYLVKSLLCEVKYNMSISDNERNIDKYCMGIINNRTFDLAAFGNPSQQSVINYHHNSRIGEILNNSEKLYTVIFGKKDLSSDNNFLHNERWIIVSSSNYMTLPFAILRDKKSPQATSYTMLPGRLPPPQLTQMLKLRGAFPDTGWVGQSKAIVYTPSLHLAGESALGDLFDARQKRAHPIIRYNGLIMQEPDKCGDNFNKLVNIHNSARSPQVAGANAELTKAMVTSYEAFVNLSYKTLIDNALTSEATTTYYCHTKDGLKQAILNSRFQPETDTHDSLRILEVATHSELNQENPSVNAVQGLGIVDNRGTSFTTIPDPELLTLGSVKGDPIGLDGTIIVISSCSTSRALTADGTFSQPFSGPVNAFIARRASTVLASAWSIEATVAPRVSAMLLDFMVKDYVAGKVVDAAGAARNLVKEHLGKPLPSDLDNIILSDHDPARWGYVLVLGKGWTAPVPTDIHATSSHH